MITPADKLRARLATLGLTQRGAAREIGISERTMRRYCSGYPIPPMIWLALNSPKITRRRK